MHRIFTLLILGAALCASYTPAQTTAPTAVMTDIAAARFLDQATWGPTPAAIAQLQQTGIANWLQSQFALNTSDLPDQPLIDPATGKLNRNLGPVQAAFFQNALTGQDQLRQRVAFALSEQWVVSAVSTKDAYAFPPYWRLFRDNAFANYRDIIKALTLSPAMGNYLNMANNNKANPTTGTAANENYARELMQLFTIGLVQLRACQEISRTSCDDYVLYLWSWRTTRTSNSGSVLCRPSWTSGCAVWWRPRRARPSDTEESRRWRGRRAYPAGP
jgi:uncharacterized protein (DUF1800 family)